MQNLFKPRAYVYVSPGVLRRQAKCWVSSRMYSVALVDDGVVTELSSRAQCGVFPGFIVVRHGRALENRRSFCVQINRTSIRRTTSAHSVLFPL